MEYSTAQVARQMAISKARVLQLRERRGVGHRLGSQWVFTNRDIAALRVKGTPGRPRKKEGKES
uniref:Uncharacterized protein n=1 Tax=viral metagenome TaxID=1070528 RepID=A0A6M3LLQ8_9ZZZZ